MKRSFTTMFALMFSVVMLFGVFQSTDAVAKKTEKPPVVVPDTPAANNSAKGSTWTLSGIRIIYRVNYVHKHIPLLITGLDSQGCADELYNEEQFEFSDFDTHNGKHYPKQPTSFKGRCIEVKG